MLLAAMLSVVGSPGWNFACLGHVEECLSWESVSPALLMFSGCLTDESNATTATLPYMDNMDDEVASHSGAGHFDYGDPEVQFLQVRLIFSLQV